MGVRLTADALILPSAPGASPAACWEYDQSRVVIGRAMGSDVLLPHPSVSARHATIELEGARYVVVDHGSRNGTRVNGQRLVPERRKPLRDGDVLDVGVYQLTFTANVPVTRAASGDHTAAMAKRLLGLARTESAPPSALRITMLNGPDEGRVLELPPPPATWILGRGEHVEVVLRDADASREHAELRIEADGVTLRDLGAKNGVFVAERRILERRLHDRDELRVGHTRMLFEDPSAPSLRTIESWPEEDAPALPPRRPSEPSTSPTTDAAAPHATSPDEPASTSEASPASSTSSVPNDAPGDRDTDPRPDHDDEADHGPAPAPVAPAPKRSSHASSIAPIEWAVYTLAFVVFVVSAAAFVWIMRGAG